MIMKPPSSNRLKKYGLTLSQWRKMLSKQGGVCAICGDGKANLVIDHCHTTGKVRGLLCSHCNTGLGCFKDRRSSLIYAVRYLDGHSPEVITSYPIAEPEVKPEKDSVDSTGQSSTKSVENGGFSTDTIQNSPPPPATPPDRLGHLVNWRSANGLHLFPKLPRS